MNQRVQLAALAALSFSACSGLAQEEPVEEIAPSEVVITTGLTTEQFESAMGSILLALAVALVFRFILKQLR